MLELRLSPDRVAVAVNRGSRADASLSFAAHAQVTGLLGLEQDAAAFVRLA